MKIIYSIVLSLVITGTQALATGGIRESGELSYLALFFIAFSALIVMFQSVPGFILFFGMLKSLFSPVGKKSAKI